MEQMEGELWKWTNYWNGWQPRWFILDQGILSYYKSLEEVEQGCKGSLNVSACEISIHPTDPLRLDLLIPGEKHMYLRASSEKVRQQWLVALGSAKACLSNQKRNSPPSPALEASKAKKAELRLYCDMLMQQVHNIKMAVENAKENAVNMELLNEGSSLLSETCDTFITTLDELMVISHHGVGQGIATPIQNGVGGVSARGSSSSGVERALPSMTTNLISDSRRRNRTESVDSMLSAPMVTGLNESLSKDHDDGFKTVFGNNSFQNEDGCNESPGSSVKASPKHDTSELVVTNNLMAGKYSLPFKINFPKPPFINGVPTKEFLDASFDLIAVFDLLGSKSFAPIKLDSVGNIQSLRTKASSDPDKFGIIEGIVHYEKSESKSSNINSGTANLLSLIGNLEFLALFLRYLIESDPQEPLMNTISKSYEETIMKQHGLVVRSVFAVALKSAPTRSAFLSSLGIPQGPEVNEQKFFQARIVPELAIYLDSLEKCIEKLNLCFEKEKEKKRSEEKA